MSVPEPIYADLDPNDPDKSTMEIESICTECEEQGVTRLMLTRIPYFREIIISSFTCDHCNNTNRHVQYGGKIQEMGVRYDVTIQNSKDMDRQVIKSDVASFKIPHLEFEQPPFKTGEITTVEGLIDNVIQGLKQEQPLRKALDQDLAIKIDEFIAKLENLKTLKDPFKIVLDDPSGNTFVENPSAPEPDTGTIMTVYRRTPEQMRLIGLQVPDTESAADVVSDDRGTENDDDDDDDDKPAECLKDEVISFSVNCPSCTAPCDTKMKIVDIPFFKEVVIMATTCDACGVRENEVKGGAGIEEKGTRITLKITDPSDLNRDVLKSDTCGVRIPEIELELMEGTLGGRFTTIEGLLTQIKDQLKSNNPFAVGDSAGGDIKAKLGNFLDKLDALISGEVKEFTLVLDDPAGNSYLQNVYAPDPDPAMIIERYERNDEENDVLGILDMKTENYS